MAFRDYKKLINNYNQNLINKIIKIKKEIQKMNKKQMNNNRNF